MAKHEAELVSSASVAGSTLHIYGREQCQRQARKAAEAARPGQAGMLRMRDAHKQPNPLHDRKLVFNPQNNPE